MHIVGFIRVWCNQFDRIRVQEGSPVLIFSSPKHTRQKGPSSLTQFTVTIENSNTSKYSTAVEKKVREGKENNASL